MLILVRSMRCFSHAYKGEYFCYTYLRYGLLAARTEILKASNVDACNNLDIMGNICMVAVQLKHRLYLLLVVHSECRADVMKALKVNERALTCKVRSVTFGMMVVLAEESL